ncbi:hypothetical protein O0L34_g19452 [Tuta absoluta]|nr:hypothetical protein O0L34_g19452 [Tuta absoluta]
MRIQVPRTGQIHNNNNLQQSHTFPNPAGPRGELDQNPSDREMKDKINEPNPNITIEQKKQNIYIGTLNTRTLRTDDHLRELEIALENINWDIIGMSEIKRMGEEILEFEDHILCFEGETPGLHGVGFIIKKTLKNKI